MDKKALYGSMLEGKIPGIEGIAAGGLSSDLGKWGAVRNEEFMRDVLQGADELASGGLSSDLGKWSEMNKELRREANQAGLSADNIRMGGNER